MLRLEVSALCRSQGIPVVLKTASILSPNMQPIGDSVHGGSTFRVGAESEVGFQPCSFYIGDHLLVQETRQALPINATG